MHGAISGHCGPGEGRHHRQTIVRRIIACQGGRIWIGSQLGMGTTIHFWLGAAGVEVI